MDAVRRLVAGLSSIDVNDLSMDELVEVLVPLERLRWSIYAVSSVVLHRADRRHATLELYGNFTPAHVTRFCPQSRASVKRRITNGRTLALSRVSRLLTRTDGFHRTTSLRWAVW